MRSNLQNELELLYKAFFEKMSIDLDSGILANSNKRFAAKPGIGKNYETSNRRILFISLDIGKDELFVDKGINSFQDYEQRSSSICNSVKERNAHMAGVLGISLFLLKEVNNWEDEWNIFEKSNKFFKHILFENFEKLPKDILSNIAQMNFFNFVEIGRSRRQGNEDRNYIDKRAEIQLNIDLINKMKPHEIVVQGNPIHHVFRNEIIPKINFDCNIYLVMHPSVLGKNINIQIPKNYIETMKRNRIQISL